MEKIIKKAQDHLKKFLNVQVEEIKKSKYLASEIARRDLGASYVLAWVKEHAPTFRTKYIKKDIEDALAGLNKIEIKDNPELSKAIEIIKDKLEESINLFETQCSTNECIPLLAEFLDTLKPLGFTPDRIHRASEMIGTYVSYVLKNGYEINKKK